MLPAHVSSRLHAGEAVAVVVAPRRAGNHAWVWVSPVMAGGRTWKQQTQEWTSSRVASSPYDATISAFLVRRIELEPWHLSDEWIWDLDHAFQQRPPDDVMLRVVDAAALERQLVEWGCDVERLGAPERVGYPDPPMQYPRSDGLR